MKIEIDGHKIIGSAECIVKKLGKFLINEKFSVDQYIRQILRNSRNCKSKKKLRLPQNRTLERRCEAFLKILEEKRFIKIIK